MRVKAALFVAALGAALWPGPADAGTTAPFTIDPFSVQRYPGETFTVTGSGCPPTGPFPSTTTLVLLLTPPTGGNIFGPGLNNGVAFPSVSAMYVPGETGVDVTPNADGSFTADITVPLDAPALDGYTVRGLCLTRLEPGQDDPTDFTTESAEASMTEAGALDVLGTVDPTTPTSPTGAQQAEAVTAPRFTG